MAREKDIKARHNERRKKRVKEQKRRRIIFFSTLALIAVLCVMFLTPIFNIKDVDINIKKAEAGENAGKVHISTENVREVLGKTEGKNLFAYRKNGAKKKLSGISYADKVSVRKKLIPPTLIIDITECAPAFLVAYGDGYALIDKTGKVLETVNEIPADEKIPVAEGIAISSANPGDTVEFKDAEAQKIIMSCIENMQKADILKDITVISFEDLTNITFNYQDRLDVICGTYIDFQRKLALFKEAINSTKLTKNSRGTINLSTTGKAIYTP